MRPNKNGLMWLRHGHSGGSIRNRSIRPGSSSSTRPGLRPRWRAFTDAPNAAAGSLAIPWGHWKTVTFVAALRQDGVTAPFVIDCPMNGVIFIEYLRQCLVPTLRPNDIVNIDNLPAHKVEQVRQIIEAAGAELRYLPAYSPDLNPIEPAFAKLKAHLRKAKERTVPALYDRIGTVLDLFTPTECRNYFTNSGYAPT